MKVKKVEILKVMDYLMKATTDEDILDNWFTYGISDGADENELKEVASDPETFGDAVKCFVRMSKFIKDGINIDGTWYK